MADEECIFLMWVHITSLHVTEMLTKWVYVWQDKIELEELEYLLREALQKQLSFVACARGKQVEEVLEQETKVNRNRERESEADRG